MRTLSRQIIFGPHITAAAPAPPSPFVACQKFPIRQSEREHFAPPRGSTETRNRPPKKKWEGEEEPETRYPFPFSLSFSLPCQKGEKEEERQIKRGEERERNGPQRERRPFEEGSPPPSPPRLRVTVTKLVYACMEWTNSPLLSATPATCLRSERPSPASCWQRRLGIEIRFPKVWMSFPTLPPLSSISYTVPKRGEKE